MCSKEQEAMSVSRLSARVEVHISHDIFMGSDEY